MSATARKYALRLLASVVIGIAALQGFYWVLQTCNLRYFTAFRSVKEVFHSSEKYDLVLLGSSRMKHHVSPAVLDTVLHLNSINLGQSAATIYESDMLLTAYLKHHPAPAYLLLGVDIFSFTTGENKVGFYPTYIPYMQDETIQQMLKMEGLHVPMLEWAPFLRPIEYDDYYKSALIKVAMAQSEITPGDYYYKGFVSNTNDVTPPLRDTAAFQKAEKPIDSSGLEAMQNILQTCKRHGIKMAFVYTPEYRRYNMNSVQNEKQIMDCYHRLSEEYGVPFMEHQYLPISEDQRLFANPGHLNRAGAELYSRQLAHILREMGWSGTDTHLSDQR